MNEEGEAEEIAEDVPEDDDDQEEGVYDIANESHVLSRYGNTGAAEQERAFTPPFSQVKSTDSPRTKQQGYKYYKKQPSGSADEINDSDSIEEEKTMREEVKDEQVEQNERNEQDEQDREDPFAAEEEYFSDTRDD